MKSGLKEKIKFHETWGGGGQGWGAGGAEIILGSRLHDSGAEIAVLWSRYQPKLFWGSYFGYVFTTPKQ